MGAMNAEELAKYKGVFVFAQQVDNKLSGIAFELVGEGSRLAEKLGTEVTAVYLDQELPVLQMSLLSTVLTRLSLLTILN